MRDSRILICALIFSLFYSCAGDKKVEQVQQVEVDSVMQMVMADKGSGPKQTQKGDTTQEMRTAPKEESAPEVLEGEKKKDNELRAKAQEFMEEKGQQSCDQLTMELINLIEDLRNNKDVMDKLELIDPSANPMILVCQKSDDKFKVKWDSLNEVLLNEL